jgi:Flp pilus assembly pilin Flp
MAEEGESVRNVFARLGAKLVDDTGASLVEYAFILAVVLVVSIVIIGEIGDFPALAFNETNEGF